MLAFLNSVKKKNNNLHNRGILLAKSEETYNTNTNFKTPYLSRTLVVER